MNEPMSQNDMVRNHSYERHWSDQSMTYNSRSTENMQSSYYYDMPNPNQQSHWSEFRSQSSYANAENMNAYSNSRISQGAYKCQFSQVLILGDSWVKHICDAKNIAIENGIQFDSQWWPIANVETIMQNLENYIKPYHKNLLIFCLISETWRYEILENIPDKDDGTKYKILMPNPEFSIANFVEKFSELRSFCQHLNPNLKVFLMTPPRIDVYQFNMELISKFPEAIQELFLSNSKYEASKMAEYSKEIYGKIIETCSSNHGWPEKSIFRNQIIAQKVKSCQKLFTKFMKSKVDTCGKLGPLADGINPTVDFLKVFWDQVKSWLDIQKDYDSYVMKSFPEYRNVYENPERINKSNKNTQSNNQLEDTENNFQTEYGEDFNLESVNADDTAGFLDLQYGVMHPSSQVTSVDDGAMDSSKLELLLIGDYTVTGLNFGVQPGMPHVTVNYIPHGKLDQLIELADSYLDEKYDALVIVPFNWEFLNLTCLMPDENAPKVPQINANISFDHILQKAKDATYKWTEQFRHLKVIWGLPYPIDFCRYYSCVVTEYGSTWNPTPEITNAILFITKKFYSFIIQLENYVHKSQPPLNYIDLRNCFFLKESVLECSFRQSDVPKFPPFCLNENGIDPSDVLCQRFKYALVDKLKQLDVKPSLTSRRRRLRIHRQKKQLQRIQGDNVHEDVDSLNKDLKSNYDDSSVLCQEPLNSHPPQIERDSNVSQSHSSPNSNIQTPINQGHLPVQEMHLNPSLIPQHNIHQANWNQSSAQPINVQRHEFPMQRTDISPQSMVQLLRADIPPPPPPQVPQSPVNLYQTDIPSRVMEGSAMYSVPKDVIHRSEMLPQQMTMQTSQGIMHPMGHHQSSNSRLSDSYQPGNWQQFNTYPPGHQQQLQMQQLSAAQSSYMPQEMGNRAFMQQGYPIPHNELYPNYSQMQGHQHEPIQQLGIAQPIHIQKHSLPESLHHNLSSGIVSTFHNQGLHSSNSPGIQQQITPTSKDLLISGSMLDTLKDAINYLKSSKPEETNEGYYPVGTEVGPILVQNEKEEISPFRILDIKESSYSCKLGLFFQQSRWKDLFLKGTKAVAMDTLFSAVKAMIMLKPGRGVKIVMITTSESFVNEVEKSLKPIVETSLIGVNNDIPFGTPIALVDSPTNLRLRLAQSRFRDASEISALIVFGDDLIYNMHSPAAIELTHLVKLIYNKAPPEYVNKVVISEAGIEEYEDVANQILGTRFSTKREKKRSQPKDDGLSLFEMLAEELEKEEAEELIKKEAAKRKEKEDLQKKIAEEAEKQKQLLQLRGVSPISSHKSVTGVSPISSHKSVTGISPISSHKSVTGASPISSHKSVTGVSPISSHKSVPGSPVSDASLPELDDEAVFAKFLESCGPDVEKEYMTLGKQILLSHEKQYQNFLDVPDYHPDYEIKKDSFTQTYIKKFGIKYDYEAFKVSWSTFWKKYIKEEKEEKWSKKMTKLQEKFRTKYGKGSQKTHFNLSLSDIDSPINKKATSDMAETMLAKNNVNDSSNGKMSSNSKGAAEDMVMLGKKSSIEKIDNLLEMDKGKVSISSNLESGDSKMEKVKSTTEEPDNSFDNKITENLEDENIFQADKDRDISKKKILDVMKEDTRGKLPEKEILEGASTKTVNNNAKKIYSDLAGGIILEENEIVNKKSEEIQSNRINTLNEISALKENEQKAEILNETGPKNLKAKMKEFEKKKYAEVAKDEDFVSLIFDTKDLTDKVVEQSVDKKKLSPTFDMFQEDNNAIKDVKSSTASSKLSSIQQQINQLKPDKKIPAIIPMKFIRENPSKKVLKRRDFPSTVNITLTSPHHSSTINSTTTPVNKAPLFKPATFTEVPPIEKSHLELNKLNSSQKSMESRVQLAESLSSSSFLSKPGGAVAKILKSSDLNSSNSASMEAGIEEIMSSIGSGKHFKVANESKSSSPFSKEMSAPDDRLALYLKEKEKLSKGKITLDHDIKNKSSTEDLMALYLKEREKRSVKESTANVSKNLSSKDTLELYLKEKQFSNKGHLDKSKNSSNPLELYLKEKEKSNVAPLDLYLKEKRSMDSLNTDKARNILQARMPALDLPGSQIIKKGNEGVGRNVSSTSKATVDLYLKDKHLNKGNNSSSSKDALELYLKEKQSTGKGSHTKSSVVGSGSNVALDLYLKEKQSAGKGNQESSGKSSNDALSTLELYLKEREALNKKKEDAAPSHGLSLGNPLDLYLKEKQSTGKGNHERSGKSSNDASSKFELYLKEREALNKRKEDAAPSHGLSLGNPLDLYLQEKNKQTLAKGKQNTTTSSKEQLELYLKEKMSSNVKRPLHGLRDKKSPIKKFKMDSYDDNATAQKDSLKNKQNVITLKNTLNLLESVCGVMGMMGHALKAIVSKANEGLPDYNKALKVFAEEDSIALVNYAIKKMNSLSHGSETHKYSNIIKLSSELLVEAKSSLSTIANVGSERSISSGKFPVDVSSIAKATLGKDSAQTYQFIKTTYLYKGLPEPSTKELEEIFKAVSKLHFTLTFKS